MSQNLHERHCNVTDERIVAQLTSWQKHDALIADLPIRDRARQSIERSLMRKFDRPSSCKAAVIRSDCATGLAVGNRTGDVDILIVPGWSDSEPDHWQSRWVRNLKTARRVEQSDWFKPERGAWVAKVVEAVSMASRPVVLVGHSFGVATILHAAPLVADKDVVGAYLVAPSDLDAVDAWPRDEGQDWEDLVASFGPMRTDRLPFPAKVIASSDDAFCSIERAQALGAAWGADVSILANSGHINSASGHGPWPEGLLTFGVFLKGLRTS